MPFSKIEKISGQSWWGLPLSLTHVRHSNSLFFLFPKLDSILRTILFKYLLSMPSGFNHSVSEGAIVGDL